LFYSLDGGIVERLKTLRINKGDFEIVKTLATGAIGKVCLVRTKKDKIVCAMKVIKKQDLLTRREVKSS
jgi:serine/threonine protein kinase